MNEIRLIWWTLLQDLHFIVKYFSFLTFIESVDFIINCYHEQVLINLIQFGWE